MSYRWFRDGRTGAVLHDRVIREADGAFIPADPDNLDWQAFEAWRETHEVGEPLVEPAPTPPDCGSLAHWRTGLKIWLRNGVRRYDDVDNAIRALETAPETGSQRAGLLAREQFEYANSVTRVELLRIAPLFGFSPPDVDQSLWRADRVSQGDLSGVWPLPAI